MNKNTSLIFGLLAAVLLGILWQFIPLSDSKERIESLPLKGLSYKGTDLPLTTVEEKIFKDVNLVKRAYLVDGDKYFLSIIDGTNNRHIVHDPYYCFKGTGWTVDSTEKLPTSKGEVSHVVLKSQNNIRNAVYWFSDGNRQFSSPTQYWLAATLRRITLGLSGPEPILIVVQLEKNADLDINKLQQNFQGLFEL